jgi:hypothetical protein
MTQGSLRPSNEEETVTIFRTRRAVAAGTAHACSANIGARDAVDDQTLADYRAETLMITVDYPPAPSTPCIATMRTVSSTCWIIEW